MCDLRLWNQAIEASPKNGPSKGALLSACWSFERTFSGVQGKLGECLE